MNQAINEKLDALRGQLVEASEIEPSELPKEHQNYVAAIERAVPKCKLGQAWDGIHGIILNFDIKGHVGGGPSIRMTKDVMDIITKFSSMRWLELGKDEMTIGC